MPESRLFRITFRRKYGWAKQTQTLWAASVDEALEKLRPYHNVYTISMQCGAELRDGSTCANLTTTGRCRHHSED